MKKLLLLLLTIVFVAHGSGTFSQQVISSGGGYFEGDNISLSLTVGEVVIETIQSNEVVLTQGFQQPFNFYVYQLINIPAGWSGISSWVDPVTKGVENIFTPFGDNFIYLASMTQFYYPAGGVNTIGEWNINTGYQVKALNPFEVYFKGFKVSDRTVELNNGWNLIPVLNSCGAYTVNLFADVNGLLLIKEVAGIGLYWPQYEINTLPEFIPGRAYWVAINGSATISYPVCIGKKDTSPKQSLTTLNSPWGTFNFTASSHVIAFPGEVIRLAAMEPGDVIGVFTPEGYCAGVAGVHKSDEGIAISAFADDEMTALKDGFETGELLQFKIFTSKTNEVKAIEVEFDQAMLNTDKFENLGISAVTSIKVGALAFNDFEDVNITIYPNPSNGIFTVDLGKWEGKLKVSIMDARGLVISKNETSELSEGSVRCFNLSHLPKGIYFLKFTAENGFFTMKKVVIN